MAVTLNASTSSGLVQTADTSGTVEIQSNGTTRLTVASGGVTATNLTATGTFGGGVITSGTAVSASSTSVDFTSIPSWVKRVNVMLNGVSTNGTSNLLLQIGDSGGIENTGYVSAATYSTAVASSTSGYALLWGIASSSDTIQGSIILSNLSGNEWVTNGNLADNNQRCSTSAGGKTLSTTLDRIRITTVNGTDTFDAGTINILYEG